MKNICFILLFLAACAFGLNAQSMATTTIHWTSERTLNVSAGTWTEETTTLTLYGRERLVWKNHDGSIRKIFLVNEIVGEWITIETEGSVQYEFTEGGNNGTITIIKTAQSTKALIVIASEEPQSYALVIQNP